METNIIKKAKQWLGESYDDKTRQKVQDLISQGGKALTDAFYKSLEFGTGGLRGEIGVGTNRMNIYTVAMATQGLANYLKKTFPTKKLSFAIARDSRRLGERFVEIITEVLSANQIKCYVFSELRTTPILSFAVRKLNCHGGIVVTASHNPPEYNGYKVYWSDGAQIVPPHDKNIIEEVKKIFKMEDVKRGARRELIEMIDTSIDKAFFKKISDLSINPVAIQANSQLKIVYSPLHGTGITAVPQCLERLGFKNILLEPEQKIPNGDFPTVSYPNPEEPAALSRCLSLANREEADLVMATDPDTDRVGIAIRNEKGELELMNGNQTGSYSFLLPFK